MSNIESMWRKMLRDIYKKGHYHQKDDAQIKEILNVSGFIDNPLSEIAPNYTALHSHYIKLLKNGTFDIDGYNIKGEALGTYVEDLDNSEMINICYDNDTDFIYTYPERLKAIAVVHRDGDVDLMNQINVMAERLEENKGSNRAVATLYQCGLDSWQEHIPCLNWLQALIRDDELVLSVMFRSNDIYNAFPSNMYFISYIGIQLVDRLRTKYPVLKFYGIYYNCTSAHYYTDEVTDEIIEKIIGG